MMNIIEIYNRLPFSRVVSRNFTGGSLTLSYKDNERF